MSKPYRVCPKCGAHLDYGERCDCGDSMEQESAQSAADLAAQPENRDEYKPVERLPLPGIQRENTKGGAGP